MPQHITQPTAIEAVGNNPKLIEEFFGQVNSGDSHISIARMRSPQGWVKPGQRPEFQEFTLVLKGLLRVEHERAMANVAAGEAIVTNPGEWGRYSTPSWGRAEYVAIGLPAFSPETVYRDAD